MDVGDFIAVLALFVSVFAALVPWWAKGRAYPTVRLEEYSIIRGGDQSSRRWQERRVVIENAGPSNAYDVPGTTPDRPRPAARHSGAGPVPWAPSRQPR